MTSTAKKNTRLEFRASSRVRAMIEQAAAIQGQTVSAFAISSLVERALQVIERAKRIELTDHDRDLFLALLDKGANSALRTAAREYQEQIASE